MIGRRQLEHILNIGYAKNRLEQCKNCPKFDSIASECQMCGCYMPAKVLIPIGTCPDKKW